MENEYFQGRRVESPFTADGGLIADWPLPGDYFFYPEHGWFATTPDSRLANLSKHTVVEHDDKTITVSPSILVNGGEINESYHGYLERGIWRAC